MDDRTRKNILNISEKLADNYQMQNIMDTSMKTNLPNRQVIYSLIQDLHKISFPGYFGTEKYLSGEAYAEGILVSIYDKLISQMRIVLNHENVEDTANAFIEKIPEVQSLLMKDVEAQYQGDPAANSEDEIILSYPGLYAIFVYRFAHILYKLNVPFLPRIMSEYAHGKTGIDINPGATIGEYFFIDHGTGIVIGETAIIGNGVKIYQGVTIGALSTRKGQGLSGVKRHPTIEDNVVIYSNATILGGETVVGKNAVVAGNTFVTESIPADARVSAMMPELKVKMCQGCDKFQKKSH